MADGAPALVLESLYSLFVDLRRAVSDNDLEAIDASTARLQACLEAMPDPANLTRDQRALVADVETLSADVADLLASRLRAMDHTITALRQSRDER